MSRAAPLLSIALMLAPATTFSQSHLQAPATGYDITPSGFTVECWVKVRAQPGPDPRIIRCIGPTEGPCGNASVEVWELFICKASACTAGNPYFGVEDAGNCAAVQATSTITDGAYHHLAGTYDGSTISIYVDGALSNSLPLTGLGVGVTGGKVVVGDATAYNNAFDGQIDDIRIWSVARTQAQIAANMNTEIVAAPGLAGYWKLNGNSIDVVAGNNLIPAGSVTFVPGHLNQAAFIVNGPPLPALPPWGALGVGVVLAAIGVVSLRRRWAATGPESLSQDS